MQDKIRYLAPRRKPTLRALGASGSAGTCRHSAKSPAASKSGDRNRICHLAVPGLPDRTAKDNSGGRPGVSGHEDLFTNAVRNAGRAPGVRRNRRRFSARQELAGAGISMERVAGRGFARRCGATISSKFAALQPLMAFHLRYASRKGYRRANSPRVRRCMRLGLSRDELKVKRLHRDAFVSIGKPCMPDRRARVVFGSLRIEIGSGKRRGKHKRNACFGIALERAAKGRAALNARLHTRIGIAPPPPAAMR